MTVKEIMERVGITETGRAVAYIKDALEEIALLAETHTSVYRQDIVKDKRYYKIPNDVTKVLDIKCKNHNNTKGDYESIPRSIYEPGTGDEDGI